MKTEYEFIRFVEMNPKPKTKVWSCRQRSCEAELGRVEWYGPWRRYCWSPTTASVYSSGCLQDIAAFLVEANREHGR